MITNLSFIVNVITATLFILILLTSIGNGIVRIVSIYALSYYWIVIHGWMLVSVSIFIDDHYIYIWVPVVLVIRAFVLKFIYFLIEVIYWVAIYMS